MSHPRKLAFCSVALRAVAAATVAGSCLTPAWATDAGSGSGSGQEVRLAVAVPYDLDFIRKSPASEAVAVAPTIATFMGESRQRSVIVNGVEYGMGITGIANDRLYMPSNLAAVAGLDCGEMVMAGEDSLCAVAVRNFWTEGDRLFVESGEKLAGGTVALETAPELKPATVAFLNYDTNFVSNPNGGLAVYGTLSPSLRIKENAIDVDASYFQNLTSGSDKTSVKSQITVNSFVFRREWFEERLRVSVGRTSGIGRGLMGGERFDGISLERFNSDDVGSVPTAGRRPITGFATGAGVIQYRVGDKVYKQLPVREGKYDISSEFLSDVPQGGRLEFVGLDGVARELSIPTDLSVSYAFYRPGDFSFNVQLGGLKTPQGHIPYGNLGGRYGLLRDLTLDLGVSATDRAFALGGSFSLRLPSILGAVSVAGATSRGWGKNPGPFASTIDANYFNRFGSVSFDVSHRQYFNGGYRGLGIEQAAVYSSSITQTTRAAVGLPVPFPGSDISLRVVAERSIYSNADLDNRSIQVDLSRSLGKLGSASLLGRYGRDQFGKTYSSAMLNWVVPLGGRNGFSVNLDTSKSEGGARENRYGATFWGSMGGSYGMGGNYQVSIDQDARISADGAYRTRFGNFNASLSREAGSRLFGNMGVRGALVMAGGGLIMTRPIADSLLVVRGKELAGSELFVPPDMEGRTRFNGAGYAVITDLPSYRRINLAFDESGLPLGTEISQETLSGSLRPYRAYVVDVPVKRLQPLRIYPNLPKEAWARGNATSGNSFAPIEVDGTLYFNAWPDVGVPLEVTWQSENGVQSCSIELPAPPLPTEGSTAFDLVELRDVECK